MISVDLINEMMMQNRVDGDANSSTLETRLIVNDVIDGRKIAGAASAPAAGKWWWARVVFVGVLLVGIAVPVVVVAGPLVMNKVVIPILDWTSRFDAGTLALSLFGCIALLPAFLLPSSPCMWIAGMTFGYGFGFLLIMAGISIGMSLPFLIGSLFHPQIHRWLEKWPKKAAVIRLSGEGDWFHQCRAVTLLRISPFPYVVYNYAAVATNVKYCPYILGSLIGTVPETFLTIYSGRLLRNLADVSNGSGLLSVQQVLYDAIGLFVAVSATVAITIYAKTTLQTLQIHEELC